MAVRASLVEGEATPGRLHIGIVTETYPPEVNGVALTLASLVSGLARQGHRVTVVRPERRGSRRAEGPGVAVVPVPGVPLPAYPELRFGLPALRRIRRAWTGAVPDAVYVATEGPLGWAAVRVAGEMGVPVISGYHTRFDDFARHYFLRFASGWIGRWLRHFHNRTRATLVPTEELARSLVGAGYHNVEVLPRAVDTRLFHPARRDSVLRKEWGATGDTPVVVHVGRIAPEKNPGVVIRAFGAFRAECPGARMVWVGDGPARAWLEERYPDFVFAGVRHGEDLARHYASGDVFLFGSRTETFGNVTLEALASGLAVVAYDYGAAAQYIRSGTHGLLAPVGDERGFIGWARYLARHADERKRLGSNARRAVSGLDPDQVARDFSDLLRRYSGGAGR